MGIEGLSRYVEKAISLDVLKRSKETTGKAMVVFDASSVIYWLWDSALSAETGGSLLLLDDKIRELVQNLQNSGIDSVFIFDGAMPAFKQETRM